MEKLDWAIEKATELGADSIILFPAEYCEKKQLSDHQIERLRNISIAAMKQCGRLYLPAIAILPIDGKGSSNRCLCAIWRRRSERPHAGKNSRTISHSLYHRPRKGIFDTRRGAFKTKGAGVRLHINILRAETAPIVALSLLSQDI